MKNLIVFVFVYFISVNAFSQADTYYISIPSHLKQGVIMYNLHVPNVDSIFNIIFSSLPTSKKGSGFMFLCNKAYIQKGNDFFNNKKVLNPENVVDSLNKYGKDFFRKNSFYILFKRGSVNYLHEAKGEYLYVNYSD